MRATKRAARLQALFFGHMGETITVLSSHKNIFFGKNEVVHTIFACVLAKQIAEITLFSRVTRPMRATTHLIVKLFVIAA